ncbi:MAG: ABC-type transport auxiliary lipoprotein family protein [Dokdonella sp.]
MKRRPILIAIALVALLSACAALGGKQTPFAIYSPRLAPAAVTASTASVSWQLLVESPRASDALDSTRIAVMSAPGVLEVFPAARWRDPAPRLLRSLIVQAFDESGRIVGVSGSTSGLSADYTLAIELRDFQAEVDGDALSAVIRLHAKLFDPRANRIVATRRFDVSTPAAGNDVAAAVNAFEQALDELLPQLVDWTLQTGTQAQQRESASNATKP